MNQPVLADQEQAARLATPCIKANCPARASLMDAGTIEGLRVMFVTHDRQKAVILRGPGEEASILAWINSLHTWQVVDW